MGSRASQWDWCVKESGDDGFNDAVHSEKGTKQRGFLFTDVVAEIPDVIFH